MPWSDNADPGAKSKPKPGSGAGPWGAPQPGGGRNEDPVPGPKRETARKPRLTPPRKPAPTPPSEELALLITRLRRRLESLLGAPFGKLWPRLAPAIAAAVVGVWLISGMFQVGAGQTGVVSRFGAFIRAAEPGWRYHLPAPIEQVRIVDASLANQTEVGAIGGGPGQGLVMTSDGDIADLNAGVQWRVGDPVRYLYNVKDPEEAVRIAAKGAMRVVGGRLTMADLTNDGAAKAKAEADARALVQAALDGERAGIQVLAVDLSADVPPPVASAKQDVAKATDDVQAAIAEAKAAATQKAADAKAASDQKLEAAQAEKDRTVQEAKGSAAAFDQVYERYRRAPAVTRDWLYLDTMRKLMANANKVIIDAPGESAPIVLPPDSLRPHPQSSASSAPANTGAGQ
jgi:membrane protease subunit HflK